MEKIYKKLEGKYSEWTANDGGLTMVAMDNLDELSRLEEKYPTRDAFQKYISTEEHLTSVEEDVVYLIH